MHVDYNRNSQWARIREIVDCFAGGVDVPGLGYVESFEIVSPEIFRVHFIEE